MKTALKLMLPVASLALFVAGPALLHAQDAQQTTTSESTTTTTTDGAARPPAVVLEVRPGYADFHYEAGNYAAHRGYNEGFDKGVSDHDTGHSFRYKDDNSYRHPMGDNQGAMSKGDYDRIYREAYVHGYERGFRRSAGATPGQ
jgi:hypothetical protein